jgi:hypothetical protein
LLLYKGLPLFLLIGIRPFWGIFTPHFYGSMNDPLHHLPKPKDDGDQK